MRPRSEQERLMFTRCRPVIRQSTEAPQSTVEITARIERLRALSVHDAELARLLDEIESYFQPDHDPPARSRAEPKLG